MKFYTNTLHIIMFRIDKIKKNHFIFLCLILVSLKIQAQESVFVHTDKSDYISGETIQFKAYLLNNGSQEISNCSKVIYFQLTGYTGIELSGLRANIENGNCKGQIKLPNSLKTGYYFLSAYTNRMRNYPFKACFNKKIFIINQNDKMLDSIVDFSITGENNFQNQSFEPISKKSAICKIAIDKKVHKPGEKIKLKIKVDSLESKTELTNLSVSITELSPFDDTTATGNIIDYLNENNTLWNSLKTDDKNNLSFFIAEKKSYIFSGKVLDKTTNSGINNVTVLLSTPDSVPNLQYYTTAADGAFYFQLNKYYDNREIFLQLKDSKSANKIYYFKIDDKKIQPSQISNSLLDLNSLERTYIENSQKIVLINKIFETKKQIRNVYPADTVRPMYPFYGVPDDVLLPSNYETMNNFSEMTRNYLWSIKFKKDVGGYKINMMDYETKKIQDKDALLLINSIPIFNFNVIEPLNTSSIKKIETKSRHIIYGKLNLYGVASLILDTKIASSIFSGLQIQTYENKVMIYNNLSINEPDATKANKIPDFRQILYWNPEIILNDNKEMEIEFVASEYKAKYSIVVQGIVSSNIPVFARSIIEIK
jgi:hypothetical protein